MHISTGTRLTVCPRRTGVPSASLLTCTQPTAMASSRMHRQSAQSRGPRLHIFKTMRFQKPQWYDELPSTNTTLVEWLREGRDLPDGFVLAARFQTAGRGRYERQWLARPGRNLTFSALLRSDVSPLRFLSLPQAAALGVVAYLEENGLAAQTKWPNDVLVGGRKVCGILAERCNGVVLGIASTSTWIPTRPRPSTSPLPRC